VKKWTDLHQTKTKAKMIHDPFYTDIVLFHQENRVILVTFASRYVCHIGFISFDWSLTLTVTCDLRFAHVFDAYYV